jgi:nucleoside-diphosphate kinase
MAGQERTLVIVKPDAMQRGLIGEIVGRLERRGLKLEGLKLLRVDRALAERHYAEHQGKPFYEGLVSYITACPVVVAVFAGEGAITTVRATIGKTNPAEAAPGTIRGDFALEVGRNLIHASDGPESAAREVGLFFAREELLTYERATDPWIGEG